MEWLPAMLAQDAPVSVEAVTAATVAAILYIAFEWLIRLVLIPIVIRKHRPAEATAWLAIVLFQPIPGMVIYMLLGRNLLGWRRVKKHRAAVEMVETPERVGRLRPHVPPEDAIIPEHRDLIRLAERVGHMPVLGGNTGIAIQKTEEVIDRLIEDLDKAQYHAHLLYYIFMPDETGRRVGEALIRAAARGVRCRLLVDGHGSARMLKSYAPQLRKAGVEVRAALKVNPFRRGLSRIDVRNHRKLAIIDAQVAYTGSQNICNANFGDSKIGAWHDLTARITGPVVYQLQLLFAEDWATETGCAPDEPDVFPEPQRTGEGLVQTIPSGPGMRNEAFRNVVLSAINEANHRVVMVSPYFVPDAPSLLALVLRALAGVQVDIIVPEKTNSMLVNAAAKSCFEELLEAGANIHLHQDGLLHAKAVTIDDTFAVFGSGNFDRRSFKLNYELNLLTFGEGVTGYLRDHLEGYIRESRPLTMEELQKRSALERLWDDAAKLFAPLL